nr:MAG TPA: hypothetical protein [Caudoviricetes sp.]
MLLFSLFHLLFAFRSLSCFLSINSFYFLLFSII